MRRIYREYLDGYSTDKIAAVLSLHPAAMQSAARSESTFKMCLFFIEHFLSCIKFILRLSRICYVFINKF